MHLQMDSDVLCLVLERGPEEVFEPDFVSEAPLVRFEAYADQCRVFGWLRLRADRLTDLLNDVEQLRLVHVQIESLVDGAIRTAEDVLVLRHQLIAVHASGPRGAETLRQRTRKHPICFQAGNYLIGGFVHAAPGDDPLTSVCERPPMIPLTDAWVEYWSGGVRKRQWVGTIVVNRDQTEWTRLVTSDDLAFDQIRPLESGA